MQELEDDLKPVLNRLEIETGILRSNIAKGARDLRQKTEPVVKRVSMEVGKRTQTTSNHMRPRIKHAMAITIRKTINELERIEKRLN